MLRMFRQLDEKRQNGESGFTLIELLVVIIIIGILAAIAIPVFLSQRERAWRSAVQSDLRNIAINAATYLTDTGTYDGFEQSTDLFLNYRPSSGVTLASDDADNTGTSFCVQGTHENLDEDWRYMPDGSPQLAQDTCDGVTDTSPAVTGS